MKNSVAIALLLSMIAATAISQDELIPPKRAKASKVGFFGGVTPGWVFVDVKPVNDYLVAAGGAPLKDDGMFLFGGGGAVYVGVINNFRVGGMGMGGSISSSSVDSLGVRRDAEFNNGFGGVTFEYVIPLFPRLDIAVGTMLGWGGVDLTIRQDVGGNLTWDDEWGNFGSGNYSIPGGQINNITRTLSGSYFVWIPSVNVEYALLGWCAVRLGASYVGMSAPSWSVDGQYDLTGVPSTVNGKGWMINAAFLVGTF